MREMAQLATAVLRRKNQKYPEVPETRRRDAQMDKGFMGR